MIRSSCPRSRERALFTGLALVTAAALALTGGVSAADAAPAGPEIPPSTTASSVAFTPTDADALPVVDSEIGRGDRLAQDPSTIVPLGSTVVDATSALIRVSVLSPAVDLTVYATGTPAIHAAPGISQSSTLLVPVAGDGVALYADAPADVRIEVLATFGTDTTTPGATTALQQPVPRADTAAGLAGSVFGKTPIAVGLVGAGDVPSLDVRAVYVTADVQSSEATILRLDGQHIPIGQGRTVVTTLVTPDEAGQTLASLDSGSGSLRLDVRGWVRDTASNVDRANVEGGFVPANRPRVELPHSVDVSDAVPTPIDLDPHADAVYTVALVTVSAPGGTTMLDLGAPYRGRARGMVVDGSGGGGAQLMLVPLHDGTAEATLRRGSAEITIVPLGDFLGGVVQEPASETPGITVDSHHDGERVDLGTNGSTRLGGVITTPGASVDHVEISGPDGPIGNAELTSGKDERLTWAYDVASPEDGLQHYVATVVDRAGHRSDAGVRLDMEPVEKTDTVIAPEVKVPSVSSPGGLPTIVGGTEYVFPGDPGVIPGDIIAAGDSAGTPEGAFARVLSVDRVGDEWRVKAEVADLADVFRQADVYSTPSLDQTDPAAIDESMRGEPTSPDGDPIEVLPGGFPTTDIVTGSDVSLPDYPQTSDEPLDIPGLDDPSVADPDDYGLPPESSGVRPAERAAVVADDPDYTTAYSTKLNLKVSYKNGFKPWVEDITKTSASPDAELQSWAKERSHSGEKGLAISNETQAAVDLTFRLKSHMTWRWGVIPTGVVIDELTVKLHSKVTNKGSVKLFASSTTTFQSSVKLGSISLPNAVVPVGPVPVVITNSIELAFRISLKFAASATIPYGMTREDTYGFTYSDAAGVKSLASHPAPTILPFTALQLGDTTLQVNVELSPGAEVGLKSKIYGITGPEFSLSAQLAGKLALTTPPNLAWGRLSVGADLVFELSGKLKVEMLSKVFADVELFKIPLGKVPLFSQTVPLWGDPPTSTPTPTATAVPSSA
ncbi:hypothetical protein NY547_16675 [Cnuibacter physcomitrellae]|uniref:hypothetical protein n=1 Tax=Cnuibacter physcomitrellae TaxID=1619308 RepID=UPI002175A685|nr:hypothetical protein [Cnuibacter physcomitrellae]MCS5498886.1 hypothetical protein [Cnuibacter physcomitrellae]